MPVPRLRSVSFALVLTLVTSPAIIAQSPDVDPEEVMTAFARRAQDNFLELTVVHLNDLTTDMLFDPPAKYSLRAQARGATMFFVQGAAKRDYTFDLEFQVFTNRSMTARPINISNFEPGTELSEGDTFAGIVALDELIGLRTPFTLAVDEWRFDYEFTPDQIALLEAAGDNQQ